MRPSFGDKADFLGYQIAGSDNDAKHDFGHFEMFLNNINNLKRKINSSYKYLKKFVAKEKILANPFFAAKSSFRFGWRRKPLRSMARLSLHHCPASRMGNNRVELMWKSPQPKAEIRPQLGIVHKQPTIRSDFPMTTK
ncbi:hypothetical protein CDAR_379531 [Caerostris darwini]|uniref:Uncharacterized protein n=1 Tax=Caerostris darwini TaxID=1538125 RepID=A0AAV4VBV1_9ARAC|nr:hypothetical protein CDAR_379531 [Caerostris darwini]